MVKQSSEGASCGATACGLRFASSEYADSVFRPRLDVTWSGDGVTVYQPLSLHANGADLSWEQKPGPDRDVQTLRDPPLADCQLHPVKRRPWLRRSATRRVIRYRDTTAAPSTAFSYKVVTVSNVSGTDTSFPSNDVRVTLPPTRSRRRRSSRQKSIRRLTGRGVTARTTAHTPICRSTVRPIRATTSSAPSCSSICATSRPRRR